MTDHPPDPPTAERQWLKLLHENDRLRRDRNRLARDVEEFVRDLGDDDVFGGSSVDHVLTLLREGQNLDHRTVLARRLQALDDERTAEWEADHSAPEPADPTA